MSKSIAFAVLATNLLAGCLGDDLQPPAPAPAPLPQPTPIALFPQSCAQIAAANAATPDGDQTLYVGSDKAKPWTAYCADMTSAPKEYLTLPHAGFTWSMYRAGGTAVGTDVRTDFDKLRIDPVTLKLDVADLTFAISTGSLVHPGGIAVASMPLGVAMSCGGGYATANINIEDTAFLLDDHYAFGGSAGVTGHADVWANNQVVEMWADGDCGWVAPALAPNALGAKGYVIALTYK